MAFVSPDAARIERLERLLRWASTAPIGQPPAGGADGSGFDQLLAVRRFGPAGSREWPPSGELGELIQQTARRYAVDEGLVRAVVGVESGFDSRAVSAAGAKGLMQLMDATALTLGVSHPFDPAENLDGGVRYLRSMLDRFASVPLALAAYNAGPGAVERYAGMPPYAETHAYVRKVLHEWLG